MLWKAVAGVFEWLNYYLAIQDAPPAYLKRNTFEGCHLLFESAFIRYCGMALRLDDPEMI